MERKRVIYGNENGGQLVGSNICMYDFIGIFHGLNNKVVCNRNFRVYIIKVFFIVC